jgi:uncharacterized membrane protein YdbT with pleckstrin-like domain
MNPEQTTDESYEQPVAYDAQGRPLYAHPPKTEAPQQVTPQQPAPQQFVHVARAVEPARQEVSEEVKKRHDDSVKAYPTLNLSENEYVINAVRRHPIGLFLPMSIGTLIIVVALTIALNFSAIIDSVGITGALADPGLVVTPVLLFCVLIGLGMFIVYYVYVNNKFFLTNESVIQEIQLSLFSRHEQTVSLANIEDASYYQRGILQQLINYGSIRLSTQGDETTYRFTYVAHPKEHIATLNNAVESFKNGRPVGD